MTIELLLSEVQSRGSCIEIGVGTGLLAVPLAEAGVEVTGVDVSIAMLEHLRAKTTARVIPVAVADAAQLPFPDAFFGAGIASWVLHLIEDWRTAATELARVVRVGGVVMVNNDQPRGAERAITRRFLTEVDAPVADGPVGLQSLVALDQHMSGLGLRPRSLQEITETRTTTLGGYVDALERGDYAFCWSLPRPVRKRAAAATRVWVVSNLGNLDDAVTAERRSLWHAYDRMP
jgi:SAM-dependent methyltransferase